MAQTRRFLGGRQPLCGIGVTSRIERICNPAVASAWIADSRPEPGPCTRTCTRRTPRLSASRAACSAATVAANGVDFFEPWNPALPEEPHVIALPCMSVMVMSVLLKVAVMWAIPSASTTFLARFALAAAGFACAIYCFSTGPCLRVNLFRVRGADPENVRKSVLNFLVARQIHARYACHSLPLPLLVLGAALADDADDASPLDHLAMLADRFDAGANLQRGRLRETIWKKI